jgi:hypothetical protein
MSKLVLLVLLGLALIGAGCATHSGSLEFIPAKGWVPTD